MQTEGNHPAHKVCKLTFWSPKRGDYINVLPLFSQSLFQPERGGGVANCYKQESYVLENVE